jgi:hypothetical protein
MLLYVAFQFNLVLGSRSNMEPTSFRPIPRHVDYGNVIIY